MIIKEQVLRVFVVVDQAGDKGGKHVIQLEEPFHVAYIHQVVHSLERVNYVDLVMVRVVHEITICYLCRKVDKFFKRKVESIEKIIHLTYLEHHVLYAVAREYLAEIERVETQLL